MTTIAVTPNKSFGRTDRSHVKIRAVTRDSVTADVVTSEGILKARCHLALDRDGDLFLARMDGYCRTGENFDVRGVLWRCINRSRFNKLVAKA